MLVTLFGDIVADVLAGPSAGLAPSGSRNVGLTIDTRGKSYIITANVARAGGLLPVFRPCAALDVLAVRRRRATPPEVSGH